MSVKEHNFSSIVANHDPLKVVIFSSHYFQTNSSACHLSSFRLQNKPLPSYTSLDIHIFRVSVC